MMSAVKTLDVKNMACPLPVLKAKKAIKSIEIGQVLEILATDPGSVKDIAAWSRQTGQELLSTEEQEGKPKIYQFLVKRGK